MTPEQLKQWICSLTADIEFLYQGVWGSICPFSLDEISVSYGDYEQTFYSVDDAMGATIINGQAIQDVCQKFQFA